MYYLPALLGFYLAIFSFSSQAASNPSVKPVLKFHPHSHDIAAKAYGPYLHFKPEDVSFPEHDVQKQRFEKALEIMEAVMNSAEFKEKVIGYVNSNGDRKYNKNYLWNESQNLLSNEDIYEIIMNGNEKMRPGTEGEMNFNSWVKKCRGIERLGTWCRDVIGSTNPRSSAMIRLNWKFYSYFETHQMVSNMVHEWIHLLGFLHGNSNIREEVPYVVGAIAGEVAKKYID